MKNTVFKLITLSLILCSAPVGFAMDEGGPSRQMRLPSNLDKRTADEADFDSANLLTPAAKKAKETYFCETCGQTRNCQSALDIHKRTHTGEKPYPCKEPGCDQRFTTSSNLTKHMRTHTGEKPYKCTWNGCGQAFNRKFTLERHKLTHTGEKPYKCTWPNCTKGYADSGALTRHMRTHTGEKPYICSICNKGYADSSALTRHMRTHTKDAAQLLAAIANNNNQ